MLIMLVSCGSGPAASGEHNRGPGVGVAVDGSAVLVAVGGGRDVVVKVGVLRGKVIEGVGRAGAAWIGVQATRNPTTRHCAARETAVRFRLGKVMIGSIVLENHPYPLVKSKNSPNERIPWAVLMETFNQAYPPPAIWRARSSRCEL